MEILGGDGSEGELGVTTDGSANPPEGTGGAVGRLTTRLDLVQQRWAPAGFVHGVARKFGDDRGGQYAALMAYYGFLSLFPLLLVMFAILGFVAQDNPELQQRIVNSALSKFPVVGDQIRSNVGSIQGSVWAVVVGSLVALWAGLGATQVAQDAMNAVFGVPELQRESFLLKRLRGLGTLAVLGVVVLASSFVGTASAWLGVQGLLGQSLWFVLTLLVNVAAVAALYVVLVHERMGWRRVRWGAWFCGLGWTLLQLVGATYVARIVHNASKTYGVFATVIGLLSWIAIQAQLFIYGAEVATVADERLWPRSLTAASPTEADVRAARRLVRRDARRAPDGSTDDHRRDRTGETTSA